MNRPQLGLWCLAGAMLAGLSLLSSPPVAAADARTDGQRHDCVVEPRLTAKLGSKEPGTVAVIHVDRGKIVKKGEPVAELDSELQRLAVDVSRLRASADLDVQTAKAKLSYADTELGRARELLTTKVVSPKKFDEATLDQALASIALRTAQLQLKLAQADLSQAQERLERRIIRAPIDGVVTEVTMSPGEYVHDQAVVMTIAMLEPLKVEAFVPIARYREIKLGSLADIEMDAPVDEVRRATVTVIDRVFDPASGTFGVRLEMPNPAYRLPGGLRCKVRFLKSVAEAAPAPATESAAMPVAPPVKSR